MSSEEPFIRRRGGVVVLFALVAGLSCGDSSTAPTRPPPPPPAPQPASVTVTPAAAQLTALGDTVRLRAEVLDQLGRIMNGMVVSWSSGDAAVATVDASGLVTAAANGMATITATAGSASGSAAVAVRPGVSEVAVSPAAATLLEGDTLRLEAVARDANGHAVAGAEFVWASSDTAVATVDGSGLVTGVVSGEAEVRATSSGVTGSAAVQVTVRQRVSKVAVSPAAATLVVGDTLRLEAVARDANGHAVAGAEFVWASSDTSVATVDGSGLVTGVASGDTEISATSSGVTGSAAVQVTVRQRVSKVAVSPAAATLLEGDTLRLEAVARDANGYPVAGAEFVWASSHTAVATVDGSGLVTGVASGDTEISATSSGVTGIAAVQVMWGVSEVAVSPAAATLLEGDTLRLEAVARDANGYPVAGAEFVWASSDTSVATVDGSGLVTGVVSGGAEVRATSSGVTGYAAVTVRRRVSEVIVSPPAVTVSPGDSLRLTAVALDENGHVVAGAELAWTSSNQSVAVAFHDDSGFVFALAEGTATITATADGATGMAEITVINTDRATLVALYEATGGSDWTFSENWLTDAPINEWSGVLISDYGGRVIALQLANNNLTGSLPPELGSLSQLFFLGLPSNEITGPIPPELGNLSNLWHFTLPFNNLTGPIPPEFGGLASLKTLELAGNDLTGPIPPTLGRLTNVTYLDVAYNDLTGPVPPELAGMTSLESMLLTNNARLRGALPASLTSLRQLKQLKADGTELCAPFNASFREWLNGLDESLVATCANPGWSDAFLTQAVQSRVFPVPLVAGEETLLRVFVRATHATSEGIPPVRARFYLSGAERLVVDIANQSTAIPTEVDEGDLAKSANAEISGDIVQPGLEMVVEIDPDNTLDHGLLAVKRIPETGRMAVDVQAMPPLDLTLIPFLWASAPDSSILDTTTGMAEDSENHELVWGIRTLLPVRDLEVDAHEPVVSTSNEALALLEQVEAIRVMEGGTGHYMGTMAGSVTGASGLAFAPGRSSFAVPNWWTMAHELGHNMRLYHAPCGLGDPDPSFPYPDGSIGRWGYDFRDGGALVEPSTADLMSYCSPRWISDFHFINALRFRLRDEGGANTTNVAARAKSLLLWGGVDADDIPFLEPAFIVDAPPALPRSGGEYEIVGRSAGGGELFSLRFGLPDVADGGGGSAFAFALPIQAGWAGSLASITMSGPGGSVTLDGETHRPMVILRHPPTGQVRGFLRDLPLAQGDMAALSPEPGLEVLFSRGIPDATAWKR